MGRADPDFHQDDTFYNCHSDDPPADGQNLLDKRKKGCYTENQLKKIYPLDRRGKGANNEINVKNVAPRKVRNKLRYSQKWISGFQPAPAIKQFNL